jgi:hypothetical protein
MSDTLTQIDPRLQHLAKWLLSIGDAVAVADVDHDGLPDIFLTNPLKRPEDRNALYRNFGNFNFQRVALDCLNQINSNPKQYGLVAGALFIDYDNRGAPSLFLQTAYGKIILLENLLPKTGRLEFADATHPSQIDEYAIGGSSVFFDYDRDGRLDLLIGNALSPLLPDYEKPTPLNIFQLPPAEYPGDRRMFHFMHHSWYRAENGGLNAFYRNLGKGSFEKKNIHNLGMPETHWTISLGTGDFDQDGWTDIYCANDYGPDDIYLNKLGRGFKRVAGTFNGSVGRDTYKGMNVSIGDLDNRGCDDIYVSNVHAPLQAEGSLLWHISPSNRSGASPTFVDQAWSRGLLNEKRFGWGAAMGDLNLDGWLDIVQANGMVDDSPDRRFSESRSYWYHASQVMRSGPEIHTYADRWGDLRGYEIFGHQRNRVYLSQPRKGHAQFIDVAEDVGLTQLGNSRGMALADFDNDGDLDLLITHQFQNADLYRNTLQETHPQHWLGLNLHGDGVQLNRDAIGTRVILRWKDHEGSHQQSREITSASGFSAQGDRRLLFGLERFSGRTELEIHWYGCSNQIIHDLKLNEYHSITYTSSNIPTLAKRGGE